MRTTPRGPREIEGFVGSEIAEAMRRLAAY
jgi:hypothetical protein